MLTEHRKIQPPHHYYNKYILHSNRHNQEDPSTSIGYNNKYCKHDKYCIPNKINYYQQPQNSLATEMVLTKTSLPNMPRLNNNCIRASKSFYTNNKKLIEIKKRKYTIKNENINFEQQPHHVSCIKNRLENFIPYMSTYPTITTNTNNYISVSPISTISNHSLANNNTKNNVYNITKQLSNTNVVTNGNDIIDGIIPQNIATTNNHPQPPHMRCNNVAQPTTTWNDVSYTYNHLPTNNNTNIEKIVNPNCFGNIPIQSTTTQDSNRAPLPNELLKSRYQIIKILGKGSFGKVFKSFDILERRYVALKVIMSNQTASINQSQIEKSILEELNLYDINKNHVVSLIDEFMWDNHRCLVFELLHMNLYEMLQLTHGKGLDLATIKSISSKLLRSLSLLYDLDIIHCDLKPENIMISTNCEGLVKLVDFGSSCKVGGQIYSYIQSRFYRAPEVMLELNYSKPIDIWSLGCLLAEISTCEPLFCGKNEIEQMAHIIHYFGFPPIDMILNSKKSNKFFYVDTTNGSYNFVMDKSVNYLGPYSKNLKDYLLKNKTDYESTASFDGLLFRGVVGIDDSFENFIFSMLNYNPEQRANPYDLMFHPFIFNVICLQLNIDNNCINLLDSNSIRRLIQQHRIRNNDKNYIYKTITPKNCITPSNYIDCSSIGSIPSTSNDINIIPSSNMWVSNKYNQNFISTDSNSIPSQPRQLPHPLPQLQSHLQTKQNFQIQPHPQIKQNPQTQPSGYTWTTNITDIDRLNISTICHDNTTQLGYDNFFTPFSNDNNAIFNNKYYPYIDTTYNLSPLSCLPLFNTNFSTTNQLKFPNSNDNNNNNLMINCNNTTQCFDNDGCKNYESHLNKPKYYQLPTSTSDNLATTITNDLSTQHNSNYNFTYLPFNDQIYHPKNTKPTNSYNIPSTDYLFSDNSNFDKYENVCISTIAKSISSKKQTTTH